MRKAKRNITVIKGFFKWRKQDLIKIACGHSTRIFASRKTLRYLRCGVRNLATDFVSLNGAPIDRMVLSSPFPVIDINYPFHDGEKAHSNRLFIIMIFGGASECLQTRYLAN